jgi:FtsP/CotA-like multicopper oxidase with cupredoxin domain
MVLTALVVMTLPTLAAPGAGLPSGSVTGQATAWPAASATTADSAAPVVPRLREFSLTVGRLRWELAPGEAVDAYAYNGQVPGPTLRVTEGDTVRVRVVNALTEPTTVHWHGVEVPAGMDGTPGLSQEPIPPGAAFTYEFAARPAGTRWYHAHVNEAVQQGGGLAGALIIDPRKPDEAPDRDYVVMSQEWAGPSDGQAPQTPTEGPEMLPGMGGGSGSRARFTVNGKAYPHAAPLLVRTGERVRLRLINAGTTATQTFALAGHRLLLTHTDGNPLRFPVLVDAVPLGVGERADVEFLATQPGRWRLGTVPSDETDRGPAVDVVYAGHEADSLRFPASPSLVPAAYDEMTAGDFPVAKPNRTFELVLSGGMMGSGAWTINGRSYPNTEPVPVRQGERVRLKLFNMSMEDHPIHLHGHTFQIVAIGDRPVAGPLKDTLTLRHMESYDIEFTATNPGRWLFHCHNLDHMMGGMMTEVRYQ